MRGPQPTSRIPEMLEQAKVEYEAILQQLNIYKVERDEYERQMQVQLQEMGAIQQTIKALEANHRRIRQQYDEDVMRLRRQLEGGQGGMPPQHQMQPKPTNKRGRPPSGLDDNDRMVAAQMISQQRGPARATSPSRGQVQQQGPPMSQQQPPSHMGSGMHGRIPPQHVQQQQQQHEDRRRSPQGHEANSLPPTSSGSVPAVGQTYKKPKTNGDNSPSVSSRDGGVKPEENAGNATAASSSGNAAGAEDANGAGSSARGKVKWTITYNTKSSAYPETERPHVEMQHTLDHQSVVCCVRFSADGSMMASGCHKTAQVFDVKSGQQMFSVSRPPATTTPASDGEDAYVRAVCFSPDGKKIVAGMPQQTIRIWDIESQKEELNLSGHESEIYSLDYVDNLIASGSGDRKVRLWDANNGNCLSVFGNESIGPADGVTSVALSPDGRLLAAASLDKVVRIWDTSTAQLLDRLEGHSDSVYSIAFSPDGKNVISGSLDRTLMLWDVSTSGNTTTRPRLLFQGHKDFVLSVAYTPDGRWLMSGSKDRTVVFWDPRSTRSVLTLSGYRNSVISVASSPTSPHFATGSGDCFACIWKYQCQSI